MDDEEDDESEVNKSPSHASPPNPYLKANTAGAEPVEEESGSENSSSEEKEKPDLVSTGEIPDKEQRQDKGEASPEEEQE